MERRKVNEKTEAERKYLVKSEVTSHQVKEKSGSNWKTKNKKKEKEKENIKGKKQCILECIFPATEAKRVGFCCIHH